MSTSVATDAPGAPKPVQIVGNLGTIDPGAELGMVSHYDVQPVLDINTNVNGTDLGTVTRAMQKIIDNHKKDPAPRLALHSARAERHDVQELHWSHRRAGHVDSAGLPADRG